MVATPDRDDSGYLVPQDLQCVSDAFQLTRCYLNEKSKRFDVPSTLDFAARFIIDRAREGERHATRLLLSTITQLNSSGARSNSTRGAR